MKPTLSNQALIIKPKASRFLLVGALVLLLQLTGCTLWPATDSSVATGFVDKTMQVDGATRHYKVYVPEDYSPDRPWPLIVFLHGAGERGDDNLRQTQVGFGEALRRHPERFPAVVVMPQCPEGTFWNSIEHHIELATERTLAQYLIDPDRIYLTGLSMGGFGSWMYGSRHTDRFAAILPICGGGDFTKFRHLSGDFGFDPDAGGPTNIEALATVPIWTFHGDADELVRIENTEAIVAKVRDAGGDVRFTVLPGVDHGAWGPAYADDEAIHWLFSQKKN